MMSGCEAAVVVKAKAKLVFEDIWQVGTQCQALGRRAPGEGTREGPWRARWTLGMCQVDPPPQRKRPASTLAGGDPVQGTATEREEEWAFGQCHSGGP